jgi:hypothetical protein
MKLSVRDANLGSSIRRVPDLTAPRQGCKRDFKMKPHCKDPIKGFSLNYSIRVLKFQVLAYDAYEAHSGLASLQDW